MIVQNTIYVIQGQIQDSAYGGGWRGTDGKIANGEFWSHTPPPLPPIRSILQKIGKIQGKFYVNEFWPPLPLPPHHFCKNSESTQMA